MTEKKKKKKKTFLKNLPACGFFLSLFRPIVVVFFLNYYYSYYSMDSPQLFLDDANTLTAIYIYIKIKEMKTVTPKLSNKMKRTKRNRQNYFFFFLLFSSFLNSFKIFLFYFLFLGFISQHDPNTTDTEIRVIFLSFQLLYIIINIQTTLVSSSFFCSQLCKVFFLFCEKLKMREKSYHCYWCPLSLFLLTFLNILFFL